MNKLIKKFFTWLAKGNKEYIERKKEQLIEDAKDPYTQMERNQIMMMWLNNIRFHR